MKTRNNEQKSGPKIGQKLTQINGNSVKNKLKLNLKLTSNERLCNRCKIHEHILSIKGLDNSFIFLLFSHLFKRKERPIYSFKTKYK